MFFVQHQCFCFQKRQVKKTKKHQFLKKGLQQNVFFMNPCFAKCEKLSFCGPFCQILVDVTKDSENRYLSTFLLAKKMPFWGVIIWAKWVLLSGPSLAQLKNGQLGPDNNTSNLCTQFSNKQNVLNPYFIVSCDKHCFGENKLGPDNHTSKGQIWHR